MAVVCPHCQGTTADSQARFCSLCGRPLDIPQFDAATIPDLKREDILAAGSSTLPPWFKDGAAPRSQPANGPATFSDRIPIEDGDDPLRTLRDSPNTLPVAPTKVSSTADQPTQPVDGYRGTLPSFLRDTLSGPKTPAAEDAHAIFAPLDAAPTVAVAKAAVPRYEPERPLPAFSPAAPIHVPDHSVVPATPFSASALPVDPPDATLLEVAAAPPPPSPLPLYSPHAGGRVVKRVPLPAFAPSESALIAAADSPPEAARRGAGVGWVLALLFKLIALAAVSGLTYWLLPRYRLPGAAAAGIILLIALLFGSRRRNEPAGLE